MKDPSRTHPELIGEISFLKQRIKELEVIKKSADEVSEYAESIINTVREPLIALDQDLRVVSVSRSFYDFFRVKPEETMGQLIYDLGNKQWDIPKLRELLETILPEKTSFDNYQVEHDFADIGRRIMLLNARQIERASGTERIILLAIEDITERKKAEEALRESEEHFRLITENISEVFWMADIALGKMYYISPAYEHIWGRPLQSLYDDTFTFAEAIHPDDVARVLADFDLQKTGQPFDHEYRIYRPDGTLRWIWDRGFPIHEPTGEVLRYVGIAQDITERKRMEEEKRRMEERSLKVVEDIFRFIPEGVLVFSRKIELLRQNQAFREIVSGYAQRLGFAEDELENLIIEKIKAGLRDNNIKEIRIARKHETGE
jgi:PAS domain S-box-containing protein